MSTSKTFTYPVTVVAYRDPKYTGGVAELYVGGRYVDWINLFEFDADKSTREALELCPRRSVLHGENLP